MTWKLQLTLSWCWGIATYSSCHALALSHENISEFNIERLNSFAVRDAFHHGNYFGEKILSTVREREYIPHGLGSYVGDDGAVKYTGMWWNGIHKLIKPTAWISCPL